MKKEEYVPLSNRIKRDLKKRLDMASVEQGISLTELLEKFIENGLKNLEKKND